MRVRPACLLLVLLALGSVRGQDSASAPSLTLEEFRSRRERLMSRLPDGPILVEADPLLSGEAGIDGNTPRFDYSYLTGYHAPGDIIVLLPSLKTSILFATQPQGLKEKTGIDEVLPRARFEEFLRDVAAPSKVLYTRLRKDAKEQVEALCPTAERRSEKKHIPAELIRQRLIKSPGELAMMRKSADATNKAHLAAMKACRPGMNEGELQKLVEDKFKAEGCDGLAFPSIVGSGRNGLVLHYNKNDDEIPEDTLIVCDIGASYRGYATDITRTLPSSGKFNAKQRAAYQCVLDAQKAAEKLLKPGGTFTDLHQAAAAVFQERDLVKWSYLRRHGLGHYVGLSVHDSGTYGETFEPGMVITIEPGYYSGDDGWGIRIEDMYIITKDGFERISSAPPREIDEIEKLMAK